MLSRRINPFVVTGIHRWKLVTGDSNGEKCLDILESESNEDVVMDRENVDNHYPTR